MNKQLVAPEVLPDLAPEEIDFKPLWDYCLVQDVTAKTTSGGIVLPDGSQLDDTKKFRVIKAGPGVCRDNGTWVPNPVQAGDVVYNFTFGKPFVYVYKRRTYFVISGRDLVGTTNAGWGSPDLGREIRTPSGEKL